MNFKYFNPVEIVFREDGVTELTKYVVGTNIHILVDPALYSKELKEKIEKVLCDKQVTYFTDIEPNPTTNCVNRSFESAKKNKAQTIVGIGGGSCLDVAKITSVMMFNDCSFEECLGLNLDRKSRLPLILLPTTVGTGSEVTNVGVYTDSQTHQKNPFVNNVMYADAAILDLNLTLSLPSKVRASTSMDAFCHAIEAYWNANSNPISDLLATESISLIINNIEKSCSDLNDKSALENLFRASLFAGLAFSQTRTTAAHVLSYPFTSLYKLPHGAACALSISTLIRMSVEKEECKMIKLVHGLGFKDVNEFADVVESKMKNIGLPTRLSDVKGTDCDFNFIITECFNYLPQLKLSPIDITNEKLQEILKQML